MASLERPVVRSDLSKTFITSDEVSDTDFSKANRQDTSFHDVFNGDKGAVISCSAAAGYTIYFLKKNTIAPFAGYRHDSQSLYMLRDNGNVQGDLKSTYQTKWNGPFTGLDLEIWVYKKLAAQGRITYHQVQYAAKANWNLIENFKHPVSFEHHAKGYGLVTDIDLEYLVGKKISAILRIVYGYWTTGKGTDTLYHTNGDIVQECNDRKTANREFT